MCELILFAAEFEAFVLSRRLLKCGSECRFPGPEEAVRLILNKNFAFFIVIYSQFSVNCFWVNILNLAVKGVSRDDEARPTDGRTLSCHDRKWALRKLPLHVLCHPEEQSLCWGFKLRVSFVNIKFHQVKTRVRNSPVVRALWAHALGLVDKWSGADKSPHRCLLQYTNRGVAVEKSTFPLKFRQLSAGFVLLVFGYLVALICFIYENRTYSLKF
jgi:hypothetical protein